MSQPVKLPVVFSFNILRNVYRQFQIQHFDQIKQAFEQQNIQAEFLPIITYERDQIETRALQIKQSINQVQEKLGSEQVHVVAFSSSGLDYRYFISELEGNNAVQSLTTIASPHRGSFLAEEFMQGRISPKLIEPVSRLIGMSSFSFSELNSENIESFNSQIFNDVNIKYFSIGGERLPEHSLDVLRPTGQHILDKKDSQEIQRDFSVKTDSDGIFSRDEIEWGTHLINFEADHGELVGIGNRTFDFTKVIGLISDNLKHNFQQQL